MMVLIMIMAVRMLHGLVGMLVLMSFGDVQPDPDSSQSAGWPEPEIDPNPKDDQ